ncbi:MAG: GNAT family N-acetyltransferase [Acetobacter sp.]|jgi:GNAT superfamily N-acetyltransferase|nr:GNAT family N-acetyltransferase [Acetobacter sp.]
MFPAIADVADPIPFTIRPTSIDDVPHLARIERSAGQIFRCIPELSWLAGEDPLPPARHLACIRNGISFVAVNQLNEPVAFLAATIHDGDLHIEELSTDATAQNKGCARALIHATEQAAIHHGLKALTLTTFKAVPWNGPFYSRLGFVALQPGDEHPRLMALLSAEEQHGFPPGTRCAMRKAILKTD